MAKRRVSWELTLGDVGVYFVTRQQAIERARQEKARGGVIGLNRWEVIGDEQPTFAPVDLDALLALHPVDLYRCLSCGKRQAKEWGFPCDECLEQIRQKHAQILYAPLPPLPVSVLQDVAWSFKEVR